MPPAGLPDAARCALLVVDVQNDYVHEAGAMARMGHDTAGCRALVPNLLELIEHARGMAMPIIFIRQTHSHWFNTEGWLARGRGGSELSPDRIPLVEDGSWGAEFYAVEPRPDELVLTKHRYDAFQYTPLELALRAKQRDTVLLCGGATDVCVRYTAASAVTRGFFPLLVHDCCLSWGEDSQERAVEAFAGYLGRVVSLAEVRGALPAAPVRESRRATTGSAPAR